MMIRKLVAGLALMLPAVAAAQTASSPEDIVVNGRKAPEPKAVETFVGAISVRSDSQLARFHQPVCPVVIGMPKPYSTFIENRIVADARRAGLDIADTGKCSANLIVVIAEDGSNLVRDIRTNRPGWLEGLDGPDIDKLIAPAPARAWSVTSLRNEDGQGLYTPPDGSGASGDPLSDKPTMRVMTASIIKLPTRWDMEASFVVIDKSATMGLTLRQIADYAAMRGLARTKPPARTDVATILSLFDPGAASRPAGLTDTDSAYLDALYKSAGTDAAVTERARIARRISTGK